MSDARKPNGPDVTKQLARVDGGLRTLLENLRAQRASIEAVGRDLEDLLPRETTATDVAIAPCAVRKPVISGWRLAVNFPPDQKAQLVHAAHRAVHARLKSTGQVGVAPTIDQLACELRAAGAQLPPSDIVEIAAREGLLLQ